MHSLAKFILVSKDHAKYFKYKVTYLEYTLRLYLRALCLSTVREQNRTDRNAPVSPKLNFWRTYLAEM